MLTLQDLKPGTHIRHRKGGQYVIVCEAKHSETREPMVVYRDADDPKKTWVRPLDMFLDPGRFELDQ